MKNEFDLLKQSFRNDDGDGKPVFTETLEFRVGMGVAMASLFSYTTLDILNFDFPDWGDFLLGAGMVLGYGFAFISFFLSRNAGKVNISTQRISIHPKKNPEKFPDSPIYVDKNSEINIYLLKSFRFGIDRTLLHMQVTNDGKQSDFSMMLKNKKKHRQYFEVLESWYRTGYSIKEFDEFGSRIFKLNQGKNYADVQRIKQEYGIEW